MARYIKREEYEKKLEEAERIKILKDEPYELIVETQNEKGEKTGKYAVRIRNTRTGKYLK